MHNIQLISYLISPSSMKNFTLSSFDFRVENVRSFSESNESIIISIYSVHSNMERASLTRKFGIAIVIGIGIAIVITSFHVLQSSRIGFCDVQKQIRPWAFPPPGVIREPPSGQNMNYVVRRQKRIYRYHVASFIISSSSCSAVDAVQNSQSDLSALLRLKKCITRLPTTVIPRWKNNSFYFIYFRTLSWILLIYESPNQFPSGKMLAKYNLQQVIFSSRNRTPKELSQAPVYCNVISGLVYWSGYAHSLVLSILKKKKQIGTKEKKKW